MRTRALGSKLESLQRRLGLVQAVDGIAATATAGIHIHTSDGSQPLATVGIADASRQLARVREEQRRRSEGTSDHALGGEKAMASALGKVHSHSHLAFTFTPPMASALGKVHTSMTSMRMPTCPHALICARAWMHMCVGAHARGCAHTHAACTP